MREGLESSRFYKSCYYPSFNGVRVRHGQRLVGDVDAALHLVNTNGVAEVFDLAHDGGVHPRDHTRLFVFHRINPHRPEVTPTTPPIYHRVMSRLTAEQLQWLNKRVGDFNRLVTE